MLAPVRSALTGFSVFLLLIMHPCAGAGHSLSRCGDSPLKGIDFLAEKYGFQISSADWTTKARSIPSFTGVRRWPETKRGRTRRACAGADWNLQGFTFGPLRVELDCQRDTLSGRHRFGNQSLPCRMARSRGYDCRPTGFLRSSSWDRIMTSRFLFGAAACYDGRCCKPNRHVF